MVITAFAPRRKSRTALYLDGEYVAAVDQETLLRAGYRVGQTITEEELQALLEQSEQRRAQEKALYLLEYRSHSRKELVEKIRRTTSESAAEAAADKMEQLGLVDDEDFARRYAKELLFRKRYAPGRVLYELGQKGIDREFARALLEELEPDTETAIREILERKYPACGQDETVRRRAAAALQRMGYRYDEIRQGLREFGEPEQEWE